VNVSSLKQNHLPFILVDEVENEANVKLLVSWSLVVFVDFTKHANNGQECIFLKLRLKSQVAGEVGLKEVALDEWEGGRVKFFNKLVDQLKCQQTKCHVRVHVEF